MKLRKAIKGRISTMAGLLQKTALTCVLCTVFATQAFAYGFWVDQTQYIFMNSPYGEPTYQIVRKAMDKVYKDHKLVDPIPVIAISETDLNGDKIPEMISYPLESDMQLGDYCKQDTLCPHYVTEVRGKEVKTIAIIPARFVSRGDDVVNGYWTLRAYNKGELDPKYFDTYVYDKKKDSYVLKPKQ